MCLFHTFTLVAVVLIGVFTDHSRSTPMVDNDVTTSVAPITDSTDAPASTKPRLVTLGVLLPLTGAWPIGHSIAGATTIGMEAANALLAPRNVELRFTWNDTVCQKALGLKEIVDMYITFGPDGLHGFVGAGCDAVCTPGGLLAAAWRLPMVSWGCSGTELSSKGEYPTLARVVGPHHKSTRMFGRMSAVMAWGVMGVLASSEVVWQQAAHGIKLDLKEYGVDVRAFQTFDPGHLNIRGKAQAMIRDIVKDVFTKVRGEVDFVVWL